MAESRKQTLPLWVSVTLLSLGAALLLTFVYPAPLVRGPAADLRHAAPPLFSFLVLHLLAWALLLAPVMTGVLLAARRGRSATLVAVVGSAAVVALLVAWPYGRWFLLQESFLAEDPERGPAQLLLIREGLGERPTLLVQTDDPSVDNILLAAVREAGIRRRPTLHGNPFYPEPGWDDITTVTLPEEKLRALLRDAAWEVLRRPRPLELVEEDGDRVAETVLLVRGDELYGVRMRPGALEELIDRLAALLPPAGRESLAPWRRRELLEELGD